MENVHKLKDFKDLRKAKMYVGHIRSILHVLSLSERGLNNFDIYGPVRDTLDNMRMNKKILEAHLMKLEKFIKEKS